MNKTYINEIPTLVEHFSAALSTHNKLSNRNWLLAATLTLFIVSNSDISHKTPLKLFAFELPPESFFPIALLLVLIINISYCSTHIQGYRVGVAFKEIVKRFDSDRHQLPILLADNLSLTEGSFMLVTPNYNRIHPVFFNLTPNGQAIWYRIIKIFVDIVYLLIPWIGIYFAMLTFKCTFLYYAAVALLPLSFWGLSPVSKFQL